MTLQQGVLGYAYSLERKNLLEINGDDPKVMLSRYADSFPKFNHIADPLGVFDILAQGNQGACQGHALAGIFSVCFFLATGRKAAFSRAAGYYLSQRHDRISGDRGSTLSGGQWVATEHGMCLERDWPYPRSYDTSEPNGIKYPFKLKITRPMRTVQEVTDWIDEGLPVQNGLLWNNTCNQEVVNDWRPLTRSGGHSTFYWNRVENGNIRNINSWGSDWNGDGCHEWTESSIDRALKNNFTVMVGYAPDEMSFPPQEALGA